MDISANISYNVHVLRIFTRSESMVNCTGIKSAQSFVFKYRPSSKYITFCQIPLRFRAGFMKKEVLNDLSWNRMISNASYRYLLYGMSRFEELVSLSCTFIKRQVVHYVEYSETLFYLIQVKV